MFMLSRAALSVMSTGMKYRIKCRRYQADSPDINRILLNSFKKHIVYACIYMDFKTAVALNIAF